MTHSPTPPVSAQDLDRVVELERELQTRQCRADEVRVRQLLAPDFVEIGASGRRWDFDTALSLLQQETVAHLGEEAPAVIEMSGLGARALAPGVVQVFWDSKRGGRRARRTSIWCDRPAGWQQVYHQGTLLPERSS